MLNIIWFFYESEESDEIFESKFFEMISLTSKCGTALEVFIMCFNEGIIQKGISLY